MSLRVFSTSLNAAGFAAQPGLGTLGSSLGYASQDLSQETGQEENFGVDFRQMMSSYTTSEDSSADQINRQPSQSQDGTSDQQSTLTDSTVDTDPSLAGSPINTVSGQPEAGEQSDADANSLMQSNRSLSAIQSVLNGDSLARVLSLSTGTQASAANVSAAGAKTNPSALIAGNQQMLLPLSLTPGKVLSGAGSALKSKADATKATENGAVQRQPANFGLSGSLTDLPNSPSPWPFLKAGEAALAVPTSGTAVLNVATAVDGQPPEVLQAQIVSWTASSIQPEAKNFAFAVRLTGASAQTANGHPQAIQEPDNGGPSSDLQLGIAAVAASGQSANKSAGQEAGRHTREQGGPPIVAADLILTGEGGSGAQIDTGKSPDSVADSAPLSATPSDAETAASTEPVRNVQLQFAGDNNQRVDIRMVEVAGEIRVSVRAGDTKLAEALQDNIPDLAKGLNQQTLRADIWTPRTESTSSANSSNSAGQSSSRGNDDSNQDGEQRQGNNRQQQNQPDWVDEFENNSGRTITVRSNQTWLQ